MHHKMLKMLAAHQVTNVCFMCLLFIFIHFSLDPIKIDRATDEFIGRGASQAARYSNGEREHNEADAISGKKFSRWFALSFALIMRRI